MKKATLLLLVTSFTAVWMLPTGASSHREAPLISGDPRADNVDVYALVSPDQPDTVTIIANYIPLEDPAGGRNFHSFDDNVLYEIHVDANGDARAAVTYQFQFRTEIRSPDTFLYNTGPIDSLLDPDWNMPQTYDVTEVRLQSTVVLGTNLPSPPVNVGPRSTPDYDALRTAAIHTLPNGIRMFGGQVDDPFFVDLGSVFDLAGLRPFNPAHVIPLSTDIAVDGVAGFNTHAIAIQVPIDQLTGESPSGVLGIYASASRPALRVREDGPDGTRYVQVSRLGNPLINEVVIPLGLKDRWNMASPFADLRFLDRFTAPDEVTRLQNALYPVLDNAPETGRGDLVAVLLTGIPGLNFTGERKADLIGSGAGSQRGRSEGQDALRELRLLPVPQPGGADWKRGPAAGSPDARVRGVFDVRPAACRRHASLYGSAAATTTVAAAVSGYSDLKFPVSSTRPLLSPSDAATLVLFALAIAAA